MVSLCIVPDQGDKQMLRQAQIANYINLLYEDSFQDWQKKRHDELLGSGLAICKKIVKHRARVFSHYSCLAR